MPLTADNKDTFPLGITLDFSSTTPISIGDGGYQPIRSPPPFVHFINSSGLLLPYAIVSINDQMLPLSKQFKMSTEIRIKMLDKKMKVNLSDNEGVITMSTVKSGFLLPSNSVVRMFYLVNGEKKCCEVNETGTWFLLPIGWQAIEFFVESDKAPSRPVTPMDNDSNEFELFTNYLLYTRILSKNSSGKIVEHVDLKYPCATFYSHMFPYRYFVISTRHGPHKCLQEGDRVFVYNSAHKSFEVKVIFCNDHRDFVLFESPCKLCENVPSIGPIFGGRKYVLLGYAEIHQAKKEGEHLEPCFASGVIMSPQPNTLGHVCGTSGGLSGLSGGPVIDLVYHQLLGICVSTDDLDDRQTSLGRYSSDLITYCKEIPLVRILPVQAAVDTYYASMPFQDRLDKWDKYKPGGKAKSIA